MKIDYAARVEIGKKESNDDRVLINGNILNMSSDEGESILPAVAVVCDGCGGYDGGGIAAQAVLEKISLKNPESLVDVNYLREVLEELEQAVSEKKIEMPKYSNMCTTIAGCVFCETGLLIFHSGDSRVYRFDKWGLAKMTVDHSVVQEMVDAGQINEKEAQSNEGRNVITRCIGANCLPPELYVSNSPIESGDVFLICSDGLWDYVSEKEIETVLQSNSSLQEMADELIDEALTNGSDDNISVCLCISHKTGNQALLSNTILG